MSSPSVSFEDTENVISDMLPSSPPPAAVTTGSRKLKKPPPITPKRFTKFFTPRNTNSSSSKALPMSSSSRQLREMTRSAINRNSNARRTTPRKTVNFADIAVEQVQTPKVNSRKRKAPYLSPESSPAQSSPSKRSRYHTPPPFTIFEDEPPAYEEPPVYQAPIRRSKSSNGAARILQRSFGGYSGISRGHARDHCTSWQDQTASFYSGLTDVHHLQQGAPPFCTASCNENSMIAVGDEDGWVHFLDADNGSDFTKTHVSFRAHTNAIMDVQFSADDMFLATGSGDQTGQIIDARTQQCVHVLAKHKSSVKQIRFQPGEDKIVATSSRDGAVQIWDLRCKGGNTSFHSAWGPDAPYASVVRTLASAHADSSLSAITPTANQNSRMPISKSEALSRRAEISVTALSFLPDGRQHLFLTASDASTCIKLWDIRGRYSLRGPAVPLSTTRHPESHNRHRHFAINSLTLGGDASRLYALSKDNTVYAYSTSHLILGNAPELGVARDKNQKYCTVGQEGLGPIYGFRHRNFHAGSFYVKASLRKAVGDQTELLAVGSTDGCPVLFPTDEKAFKKASKRTADEEDDLPQFAPQRSMRPLLSRTPSSTRFPSLLSDTIPIYEHGTPLIRGHDAEVTSVSWTKNGTLVSVGDDCRVRHWKEGRQARDLRLNGESDGRRWQCGWAVVDEGHDDEDE